MQAEKNPDSYLKKEFRDSITDFTGTCVAVAYHVSGCTQLALAPKVKEDGKLEPSTWFDDERLVEVGTEQPAEVQSGRGPAAVTRSSRP